MRYRSPKTAKVYRTRRLLVAQILAEQPHCQIRWSDDVCLLRSDCVHELRKRSQGGSILDRRNCIAACHRCNSIIEDEPLEAHRRGFVLRRGDAA